MNNEHVFYAYQEKTKRFSITSSIRRSWKMLAVFFTVCFSLGFAMQLKKHPWILYGSEKAYTFHRYCTFDVHKNQIAHRAALKLASGVPVSDGDFWHSFCPAIMAERPTNEWVLKYLPCYFHGHSNTNNTKKLIKIYYKTFCQQGFHLTISFRSLVYDKQMDDHTNSSQALALDLILTESPQTLTLYWGQPDPIDLSHFTIKYTIDNIPGTIDGWLQNDDTVKLQIRDGPAKLATTMPSTQPSLP